MLPKASNRCTKCNKSPNLVTLLLFYSEESLSWVYHQTNRVYYNHQGSITFFSKSYRIVIYGQILTFNCHINWPNSVIFVHALERNKSLIPHAPGGSSYNNIQSQNFTSEWINKITLLRHMFHDIGKRILTYSVKGKYHCTPDLQCVVFGFSCIAT